MLWDWPKTFITIGTIFVFFCHSCSTSNCYSSYSVIFYNKSNDGDLWMALGVPAIAVYLWSHDQDKDNGEIWQKVTWGPSWIAPSVLT